MNHFTYQHQVMVPWTSPTAHFEVGADGVESIEESETGVRVRVKKPLGSYVLTFTAGGYGWQRVDWPCQECGKLFDSATARDAHKRSHKANHRGLE